MSVATRTLDRAPLTSHLLGVNVTGDLPDSVNLNQGDVAIVALVLDAGTTITTPAGWTLAPTVVPNCAVFIAQNTIGGAIDVPFTSPVTSGSVTRAQWWTVRGLHRQLGTIRAGGTQTNTTSQSNAGVDTQQAFYFAGHTQLNPNVTRMLIHSPIPALTNTTNPGLMEALGLVGATAFSCAAVVTDPTDFTSSIGPTHFGLAGSTSTAAHQGTVVIAELGDLLPQPERIRSHVSEDAGSLFQATQAVAVESAVSEAFPYATTVEAGAWWAYREALTPNDVAIAYHPIPTRNQEMLATVEGETNLGRMARVYPRPIMVRVADIPGHEGDAMTAQEAIQYIFNIWAGEFSWFQPAAVPDLRLLVPEAVGNERQHYVDHPEAGVVTIEAIAIPQSVDNRRTMREIVDEWMTIFPGTIVRQNAAGSIELVPRVGPDAPDGAALTLEWRDILSMSDGEDDPRGVINRARVTSQGWEWREDQAVVPPLYVLATRSDGLTAEAMQEVTDELTAEPLANGSEREFEVFVEPDTPLDVDVTFSAWSASNSSGTGGLTEEVNLSISFTVALGQTRTVEFSWFIFGVDNEKTLAHVTRTERGLKVRVVGDRYRFGPNPFAGTRYVAYLLEVTAVTGTAWTRSNEAVTAEFSLANGDVVPGPDGSNALATSTALYGEREATIRSDVFQLTPEQAQAVAQGYVLHNINPRTIRDVQQSEWNAYPVKFDHVGRLVDLPNGERAVVENRSYSDSFAPNGGFMQSTFTATVTELAIDTTTEYLYLDSGDYMRLDDGTLVEAS